ncbi:pyridoxal-phosphate dependent enzyme [Algivirga pacifica]|uniref:Threonine synthase n=1 Tax=Algivirga pacifica TaxID=1162670 RepID=A0ABP9CY99_9BACT
MAQFNHLEGVQLQEVKLSKEVHKKQLIVKDITLPLNERLEALEDIINLEVGDTSLMRARNLEREKDFRQLYIKFEGDNPTGTQKDRIAFAQVYDALRRGYDTIVAATCGNYGVAVSLAAYLSGLKCKIYIPASFHTERVKEMEKYQAEVIYLEGTYEEVVEQSSQIAIAQEYYDANPGGNNTPIQIMAYAQIAFEIYDQLRDAPKYLACPVSNGTLLAGVYRGFVNLYKRGKTSRIPHFVAGSSAYKNPIVTSFKSNHTEVKDLNPARIKETKVNEPLINWHSFDGNEALHALQQTDGFAAHISDKEMLRMSSFLSKNDGIKVLPSSTAGLLALLKLNEQEELSNDRYVSIITARN